MDYSVKAFIYISTFKSSHEIGIIYNTIQMKTEPRNVN